MANLLITTVAAFFLAMGIAALRRPAMVLGLFGTEVRHRDTMNEIRAVYGGFGVAVAGLLGYALVDPVLRPGLVAGIAIAVLGMASGRLWSAAVDRGAGFFPCLFFVVEIAIGAALLAALRAYSG
jgi:hypothetical protein